MSRRRKESIHREAGLNAHWNWFFSVVLIVVTLLAYEPAWNGKPIMDDAAHLTNTLELRSLSGLTHLWIQPQTTRQYHPLLDTMYWIEDKLWGESMLGYHIVNILLHGMSALLLLKILRELAVPGAWLAAALFALHPVQVESVAWMAELKNTLSGILFFGSVLAYLQFERNRSGRWYALVLFLFALGLMAKAIVAMLPAVILIVLWWKRGSLKWKRDVQPLLPFFVMGIAAGVFSAWMEREFAGAQGEAFKFSAIQRFLIAGRAFWFYLGKLFLPSDLVLLYPRWDVNAAVWWQYLFPITALCLLVVSWLLRGRWRWLPAALLFFTVMLLPMLGFFNVNFFHFSFVADHFQYLATIGIFVPLSAGAALLLRRLHGWQRTLGYGSCIALLGALTILTWKQSHMYRDTETCCRAIIEKNPASSEAYMNIGHALFDKGLLDQAKAHFQKALELDSNNPSTAKRAYMNLGNVLSREDRLDEAIIDFEKALKIDPNYGAAHSSLGRVLRRKGQWKQAIFHIQKSLETLPRSAMIHSTLAWMLATCSDSSLRNGPRAVDLAERANRLSNGSDPLILRSLAAAYAENGQFSQAVETGERALQLAEQQRQGFLVRALPHEIALYRAESPYHEPSAW
jgi:tetratricopeptide (TPR) repeat protein